MIPLRDVIPSRTTPYVTVTIIILNALAWLFELSLPHEDLNQFLTAFGVVPAFFAWPTLITSMFLHGSWSHVIGNMWYLWIFGDNVEDNVGHGRFILFYLLCGVAAAVGQGLVAPAPMLGASGAIAGVLGAYLVLAPRARIRTLIFLGIFITVIQLPAIIVIGFFIVIQIIEGVASLRLGGYAAAEQVAYFAHIFGFVAGIVLLFLLRDRNRRDAAPYGRYG
jgi:membrane associated rhomboid family serine protease